MAEENVTLLSESNKNRCVKELSELKSLRIPKKSDSRSVASVLIPLVTFHDQPEKVGLLYTKRSAHLSKHAREVCFPGGKVDGSESPIEAAIREAHEEIGLEEKNLEIWTSLPPISDAKGK